MYFDCARGSGRGEETPAAGKTTHGKEARGLGPVVAVRMTEVAAAARTRRRWQPVRG
jgi:hypothetical protein